MCVCFSVLFHEDVIIHFDACCVYWFKLLCDFFSDDELICLLSSFLVIYM